MERPKLSDAEQEDLSDIVQHDGIKPLLKELYLLVLDKESDISRLNIDAVSDRQLVISRAKAQGARDLFVAFETRLKALKSRQ